MHTYSYFFKTSLLKLHQNTCQTYLYLFSIYIPMSLQTYLPKPSSNVFEVSCPFFDDQIRIFGGHRGHPPAKHSYGSGPLTSML